MTLSQLTRRHGIKIPVGVECSVEECSLAVGEIVGHDCIKSASRMNSAVVLFLETIDKVNQVVEQGIVIKDEYIGIFPLVNPAKRVVISNAPPFISDEILEHELARHGQIVSAVRKIPLGCKSPLLKHVVSFRRQLFMILKGDAEELNIVLKFKVEGFDYVVFATTETMKCFRCGGVGHQVRFCPEKNNAPQNEVNKQNVIPTEKEVETTLGVQMAGESANTDKEKSTEGKEKDCEIASKVLDGEMIKDVIEAIIDEESIGMEEDDLVFKIPVVKRKSRQPEGGSKSKKQSKNSQEPIKDGEGNSSEDASDDSSTDVSVSGSCETDPSDTMVSLNESQGPRGYSLEKVQRFLIITKGKRNVVIDDFFPDRNIFIESANLLMRERGEDGLSSQDVHRLKKIVQKVRTDQI